MKIDNKTRFSFAIGGFGKDLMFAMSTAMFFYFDTWLGISSAFLGTMMMIVRVFDAVNDPIMGSVVERTKSRWGKYRPWILIGAILNGIVTIVLFSNPNLDTNSLEQLVFITTFYVLWGVTYTLMDIPFWSMIPTFSADQKERESITVLTRLFTSLGYFVVAGGYVTLATSVLSTETDPATGMFRLSIIVAVVFVVCEIITVLNAKDKIEVKDEEDENKSYMDTLKKMITLLKENDQLLVVMSVVLIINFTLYITSGMAIYYITYNVGNPDLYIVFIGIGGIMQVIGSVVYPLFAKRFVRKQIYNIAILIQFAGFVLSFVNAFLLDANVILMFVFGSMVFLGQGIFMVLQTVLLSDTVEYGELKTGKRSESVAFSVQTFIVKLAMGLSLFVVGIGIDVIGIIDPIKDADGNILEYVTQSSSTLLGISILMFVLPLFGLLLGRHIFNKRHMLDENKYAEVLKELEAKRGSGINE